MAGLDLLLINPPGKMEIYQNLGVGLAAVEPPVWAGLLAEHARRRGYAVALLDAEAEGLTHEQTGARAAELDAALTLFVVYGQQPSASTQCMPGARKSATAFRALSDRPAAMMGTHCAALPERTLREEPVDFVFTGEGPATLDALLAHLVHGKGALDAVPGLVRWDGDRVAASAPSPNAADLDADLPRQALDLLDMTKYRAHNWHAFNDLAHRENYASLQTSLGCSFKCSFCCINAPFGGPGMRYWSVDTVMAQIDEMVTRYGVRHIKVPDEMFVLNRRHVSDLCDALIERDYGLNFWAYARIDTLHPDLLGKLKKAGFNWLCLGIESGSKHVRDGVTKGRFGNVDIADAVARTQDHGIAVLGNYIFGLPDDTMDSMRETLDLALDLNTEWANFYCAMAYPGSALHVQAKAAGLPLPDDPGGPGWIGYSQHAYDCMPLPTEALAAEQVLAFRDQAFIDYFDRPDFQRMVGDMFGEGAAQNVRDMLKMTLPRRHHTEPGWMTRLQKEPA